MRSSIGFGAVALMTIAMASACVDSPESDVDTDDPTYEAMGGNPGSGGTNGLGNGDYWLVEPQLVGSFNFAAADGSTQNVNPIIGQNLLSTAAGQHVFNYAAQCALAVGETLTWNGLGYSGMGHMVNAKAWKTQPLGEDLQNHVLECMIAHINPLGLHIGILLSGAAVLEDYYDHSAFDTDEALWVVTRDVDGTPAYYAWPLSPLKRKCMGNPDLALQNRVCGQNPLSCRLKAGHSSECTFDTVNRTWTCMGKPALKTTLRLADFTTLYNGCK